MIDYKLIIFFRATMKLILSECYHLTGMMLVFLVQIHQLVDEG